MDNSTGKTGEDYTENYLKKHGYQILCRNFHARFGEIDIVAANRQYIVFVEVKTRAKNSLVSPWEAVTRSKQQKLVLCAKYYLTTHQTGLQPRFDVAAVTTENRKIVDFQYLENAFGAQP